MSASLPGWLRKVLPRDTQRSWVTLREVIPDACVLYGGTALAAHLQHRVSRDLDFFHAEDLDIPELRRKLEEVGTLAVTYEDDQTLNALFNSTRVQFLHSPGQDPLMPTTDIAGLKVAGLRDIAATKLKVVADQGELPDYFDLMVIEQHTPITIETALLDYQVRFRTTDDNTIAHILLALCTFADVNDDPGLPVERASIEDYWRRRSRDLLISCDISGLLPTRPQERPFQDAAVDHGQVAAAPDEDAHPGAGFTWVEPHERNGRNVGGYWRRR